MAYNLLHIIIVIICYYTGPHMVRSDELWHDRVFCRTLGRDATLDEIARMCATINQCGRPRIAE